MALPGGRILGCGGGGGGPYAPAKLMATIYYPSPQEKPKNTKKREQESTAKLFFKITIQILQQQNWKRWDNKIK